MRKDIALAIGERLKEARQQHNLTQIELAELSGWSTRHIGNIEKGKVNPSFGVLFSLSQILEVSFDDILCPISEQTQAEIDEISELYLACPESDRWLILAIMRAVVRGFSDRARK